MKNVRHKKNFLISVVIFALVFLSIATPYQAHAWGFSAPFVKIGEFFSYILYQFFFFIAWISSALFGLSLKLTVFEMGQWINEITALKWAWSVFRDMVNLSFIFILLYSAISIIIDKQIQVGRILSRLVIVAILINFSFFFVSFIADISNYISYEIYNTIEVDITTSSTTQTQVDIRTEKLTSAIMNMTNAVRVQTVNFLDSNVGSDSLGTDIQGLNVNTSEGGGAKIIRNIMSSILMIALIFVFLSAATMFIFRFLALIIAMVVSPVIMAAYILPNTQEKFKEWSKYIFSQAFWVPLYLFFLYIGLVVLAEIRRGNTIQNASTGGGIYEYAGLIFQYIIVIAIFLLSLLSARKLGAAGVNFSTKLAGGGMLKLAAFTGRNTFGRGAAHILRRKEKDLTLTAAKGGARGYLANLGLKNLKGVQSSTFDARNSGMYKKFQEKAFDLGSGTDRSFEKRQQEKAERIKKADKILGEMSDEEKKEHEAAVKAHLKPENDLHKQNKEAINNEYNNAINQLIPNGTQTLTADQTIEKERLQEVKNERIKQEEERHKNEIEELNKTKPKSAGEIRQEAFKQKMSTRSARKWMGDQLSRVPFIQNLTQKLDTQISNAEQGIAREITKIKTQTDNLRSHLTSRNNALTAYNTALAANDRALAQHFLQLVDRTTQDIQQTRQRIQESNANVDNYKENAGRRQLFKSAITGRGSLTKKQIEAQMLKNNSIKALEQQIKTATGNNKMLLEAQLDLLRAEAAQMRTASRTKRFNQGYWASQDRNGD